MNPLNRPLTASSAAARYRGVQVATCSPAQLVVMLYDGAIRFAREAETAMVARDRARAGTCIGKAHAILEELCATLDPTQNAELCENLANLYLYAMGVLLQANLQQDPKKLVEVAELLLPLREAWATVAKQSEEAR